MSRRKRRGLAEDQIGLVIKPQKCICCIKTEGELGYHKAWWIEKVPSRKIWVRCLDRSLDFDMALNLCTVLIYFPSKLRNLFQIYGALIEIEYLLVLILWIVKFQVSSRIRTKWFLKPWKKIFGAVIWLTLYINIGTFKILNLYILRNLFDWNYFFVCSNFPLLQIMRIAGFC